MTLSFVNKPLEFISYHFENMDQQKNENDESIKKTFKIMKNRKFSDKEKSKETSKKTEKDENKNEEPEEEEEQKGKLLIYKF